MKNYKIFYMIIGIAVLILAITIYFKENTYEVIFAVYNGDIYEVYETDQVRKNTKIGTLPKPEKEGYTFIGWYDEENNILEKTTKITKNSVYYAKWAQIITEEEDVKN